MRLIIQRVLDARVDINGETVGQIGQGLLVLVGIAAGDDEASAAAIADRLCKIRLFEDANGKMNLSTGEIGGGLLLVPNFTVYADTSGGTRPSFSGAAPAEKARAVFDAFVAQVHGRYTAGVVASGVFQADMAVTLTNDGPVTVILESK